MEFYRLGTRFVAGVDIVVSISVVVLYSMYLGYMLLIMDIILLVSTDEQKQREFYFTLALLAVIIGIAFLEMCAAFILFAATQSGKQTNRALSLSKFWLRLNVIWISILLLGAVRMVIVMTNKGFLEYDWTAAVTNVVFISVRFAAVYIVSKFMGQLRSPPVNTKEEIPLRDL